MHFEVKKQFHCLTQTHTRAHTQIFIHRKQQSRNNFTYRSITLGCDFSSEKDACLSSMLSRLKRQHLPYVRQRLLSSTVPWLPRLVRDHCLVYSHPSHRPLPLPHHQPRSPMPSLSPQSQYHAVFSPSRSASAVGTRTHADPDTRCRTVCRTT